MFVALSRLFPAPDKPDLPIWPKANALFFPLRQIYLDIGGDLNDVTVPLVDIFDHLTPAEGADGYVRPALQGTADRMANLERKNFVQAA